jgi:RHS repeat-associated protein
VADYSYGPFGELARAVGMLAKMNTFRFSTKFRDQESDLAYYGYRYYRAEDGKWTARDPLGDSVFFRHYAKGLSDRRAEQLRKEALMPSYGFVRNNPVRLVDDLGLACLDRISVLFYNSTTVDDAVIVGRDGVSRQYLRSGRQFIGFMRTFDSRGHYVQGYAVKSGGNRDAGSRVLSGDDTSVPSGNFIVGTAVTGIGYPIESPPNRSVIRIHDNGVTTGCIAVTDHYADFQRDMADTRDVAKRESLHISIAYRMGDLAPPPHGNTGYGTGDPGNPNFNTGPDADGPPTHAYGQ